MKDIGVIRLGQAGEKPFPVLETAGAIGGAGLAAGGLVVKGTAGTIMGILGGAGVVASAIALISKLVSREAAPAAPTAPAASAPPPAAPPPPPVVKASEYSSKYGQYIDIAKEFLPYASELVSSISSLFGSGEPGISGAAFSMRGPKSMWRVGQPEKVVVVGRG